MRYHLAFAALLLPLAGCVVPPGEPYYGYPQPGYPVAGYPPAGYPQPYGDTGFSYPGYAFVDGSPVMIEGGVTFPLIFYGGSWGYWDGYHNWHGAPGPVGNYLGRRYPGGAGYRPYGGPGGYPGGYHGSAPPPGGYPGGYHGSAPPPGGYPGGYHGSAPPPGGYPGGYHGSAPPPGGNPGGYHGSAPPPGAAPGGYHMSGPPPGAQRPGPAPVAAHAPPPSGHSNAKDDHH